jgi:hypothetical protein
MTRRNSLTASASPAAAELPTTLTPARQALLSLVLAFHVLAVFLAPLMFASAGSGDPSPAVQPFYQAVRPYTDLLYLNHGYFFFAPNPGPNHLVRYELVLADGKEQLVGQFPDRTEQWPRLLYHRHFMLSETLNTLYRPPQGPPEPSPPREDSRRARHVHQREKQQWQLAHDRWQEQRALYEKLRASISDHLKHEFNAREVTLIRREHRPLYPLELSEDRLQLTDEETYRTLPELPVTEVLPWNPVPSR